MITQRTSSRDGGSLQLNFAISSDGDTGGDGHDDQDGAHGRQSTIQEGGGDDEDDGGESLEPEEATVNQWLCKLRRMIRRGMTNI